MSQTYAKTIPAFACCEGRFEPLDRDAVPEWALPLLNRDRDSGTAARDISIATDGEASRIESYGESVEGLDVWKCGCTFAMHYWCDNQPAALVIINGIADYLAAQPWIAALAMKVMTADTVWRAAHAVGEAA